jgi:hypothetical protein
MIARLEQVSGGEFLFSEWLTLIEIRSPSLNKPAGLLNYARPPAQLVRARQCSAFEVPVCQLDEFRAERVTSLANRFQCELVGCGSHYQEVSQTLAVKCLVTRFIFLHVRIGDVPFGKSLTDFRGAEA